MLNEFSRTQLLLGPEAMEKLAHSRVAVFGVGGVGGYTVEALARSGIGALDLIDDDKVCLTNINRQILATRKTVGKYKVDVAAGGSEHQLPRPLHLPAGDEAPLHRPSGYPRLCGLRASGRRTDHCGRSGKGFV